MGRLGWTIFIAAICFCDVAYSGAEHARTNDSNDTMVARISLIGLEATGGALNLRYEVTNASAHDVWMCDCVHMEGKHNPDVFFDEGEETLHVRRRLAISMTEREKNSLATYVRLAAGTARTEALSLSVPVRCPPIISRERRASRGVCARRLVVQVGFYEDLPAMVSSVLEEAEQGCEPSSQGLVSLSKFGMAELDFLSLWQLNRFNKVLDRTTSEVVVPFTLENLGMEHLLGITIDGLRIPWERTRSGEENPKRSTTHLHIGRSQSGNHTETMTYTVIPSQCSYPRSDSERLIDGYLRFCRCAESVVVYEEEIPLFCGLPGDGKE